MKQSIPQSRPHLTSVAAVDDLETQAWVRVADALRDYAAAVEALEYAGAAVTTHPAVPSPAPLDSARAPGQGRFDLAAAACAHARRRVEQALLILDAVTGAESQLLTDDGVVAYFGTEDSAAS